MNTSATSNPQTIELAQKLADRTEAAAVLNFFGAGGYGAGSFTTQLIRAYSSADRTNQLKLATMYPTLAAAFDLCSLHAGGTDEVARFVAGAH